MMSVMSATGNNKNTGTAWWRAVRLVERVIVYPVRENPVMQGFDPNFLTGEKSLSQHLFYGVIRELRRLDGVFESLVSRPPRPMLSALLRVAGFELLSAADDSGRRARIVDHATGEARRRLSIGESRMVNAVLRRFPDEALAWETRLDLSAPSGLAAFYSHPTWMVRRWMERWGRERTVALLAWNQKPPTSWLALRAGAAPWPAARLETWHGVRFIALESPADWAAAQPLLEAGEAYVQDPATALGPQVAQVEPGQAVLDLCSAPGGKAWQLLVFAPGLLVSVDRPSQGKGKRHTQWVANTDRMGPTVRRVECDLVREAEMLEGRLTEAVGVTRFDRVFIDVPCSNTGTMRRRPEVRWHLTAQAIGEQAVAQAALLRLASRHVAPGGRLVYSSCSLEPEENEEVAAAFGVEAADEFQAEHAEVIFPPEAGHDGAGVFSWLRKPTGTV